MANDTQKVEKKITEIQKVRQLIPSEESNAFSALIKKNKDAQRKIDATLNMIRERNAKKEQAKLEEAEKAKQAEIEKKQKPVAPKPAPPTVEKKPEPVPEVKAPETVVEDKKEEVKSAPVEKKETIRVFNTPETATARPSFVRGMYTPPPPPQRTQPASRGQNGGRPDRNGQRPQGAGSFGRKAH